jgi:hypothetical protein
MRIFLIFTFLLAGFAASGLNCVAQAADDRTPLLPKQGNEDDDHPHGLRESLEKMRIEKEKKDFQEMLARSDQALALSEHLRTSFSQTGKLSREDVDQINSLEKLVKKIRSELGGDGDGDEDDVTADAREANLVEDLHKHVVALRDELKRTSRFTISAAAIESSNSVLRLARLIRVQL